MLVDQLSEQEREIVFLCLRAIAEGPFIDDCCIHTVIGLDRIEIRQVLDQWPDIKDAEPNSNADLAINNCMNAICHYPLNLAEGEWQKWFPMPIGAVRNAFANVRPAKSET